MKEIAIIGLDSGTAEMNGAGLKTGAENQKSVSRARANDLDRIAHILASAFCAKSWCGNVGSSPSFPCSSFPCFCPKAVKKRSRETKERGDDIHSLAAEKNVPLLDLRAGVPAKEAYDKWDVRNPPITPV